MSTFAVDVGSSPGDIIGAVNYALANLGQGSTISSTANVLVSNITTGQITTTSSNSSGYTSTTIVSYLYQYMDVKYANSSTGGSGFSGNSLNKSYYGLRNTANTTISSNPADYIWYQVSGGFGTTKSLWYQTIGGRQVAFFAGTGAPTTSFTSVPDNTPLNLDSITAPLNNQVIITSAYFQANTTPATPSGGTYDFTTFTLTPPSGWSATIPSFVANTSIYISQTSFSGNTNSTAVPPSTTWTTPVVYTSASNGNAGPAGTRGFVPMGYVVTDTNPTTYTSSQFTTAFSSSRSNPTPPIGLGYAPIANDTAQFAWTSPITGNVVTTVQQYNGTTWSPVPGQVISGGVFIPGSITANVLNANDVYALNVQSTNAILGNVSSPGYWLQSTSGDARLAGNVSIGDKLIVGSNAQIGGNLNVGTNAQIGDNLAIGNSTSIGNNLTIGNNTSIGNSLSVGKFLTVGANASIGGNLTVSGLVINGNLANNTVNTNTIITQAVSTGIGITTSNQQTYSAPAYNTEYYYTYCEPSITTSSILDTVYINSVVAVSVATTNGFTPTLWFSLYRERTAPTTTGNVLLFNTQVTVPYQGTSAVSTPFLVPLSAIDIPGEDGSFVPGTFQYKVSVRATNYYTYVTSVTFLEGTTGLQLLKR